MESTVTTRELPMHLVAAPQGHTQLIELPEDGLDLESYLDEIRVELMRQALDRTEGVQTQAAEILGMTFRSFRYYAKKLGIHVRGKGQAERSDDDEAARILDSLPENYPEENAT